jgi:hypothetical protein
MLKEIIIATDELQTFYRQKKYSRSNKNEKASILKINDPSGQDLSQNRVLRIRKARAMNSQASRNRLF